MTKAEALKKLRAKANKANVAGMARFGINPRGTLGVSMPDVRRLAKEIGKNHSLAEKLWQSAVHEAQLLAGLIDDPDLVTKQQMNRWVRDFDSWDICDQVCSNLFDRTPWAYDFAKIWAGRREEFVKRAGYVMMATLSVHDKVAPDSKFVSFFPLIKKGATDERNFVKKAANWALRKIGKRNSTLMKRAVKLAREIEKIDSPAAHWVARDALREFKEKSS